LHLAVTSIHMRANADGVEVQRKKKLRLENAGNAKAAVAAAAAAAEDPEDPNLNKKIFSRREKLMYTIFGRSVCRPFFLMCHHVGTTMLKGVIKKVLVERELVPEASTNRGGSAGAYNPQLEPIADMQNKGTTLRSEICGSWFLEYTKLNGYPNPGKTNYGAPAWQLPHTLSMRSIWNAYVRFVKGEPSLDYQHTALSFSRFKEIWKRDYPHVKISGCKTDFCEKCNLMNTTTPPLHDEKKVHLEVLLHTRMLYIDHACICIHIYLII
jgi:hypothetical protein